MKFRIATATFAAFASMSAPYVSAQSFAPSAAENSFAPSATESFAPSAEESNALSAEESNALSAEESNAPSAEESNAPSAFGSIAPSFESVLSEPSASAACSAYPACSALALDGDCCPTSANIVLACCSGTPSVVEDSATPSPGVENSASPIPTPSPADDEESSAPSDSPALSFVPEDSIPPSDADEEKSSAPSATTTSSLGPPQSTPPADLLLSITPVYFEGCIEDEDNISIDKVFLRVCDSTKLEQKFKYDGAFMRTGSNEDKCLQAGYDGDPAEGEFVRVVDCDLNNSLQKFTWDFENGFISLTDNPSFCMSFRGMNDNVGADPILMKKCALTDFEGTNDFKWGFNA